MLSIPDLLKILPTLPRVAIRGPWYRAVLFDYLLGPPPGTPAGSPIQPLWPGGAPAKGARFTPKRTSTCPSFDSLYLALDENTPLLEISGILRPPGSPVPLLFEPQAMMTVDGVLTGILDLSDIQIQNALGTNLQTLTGDWIVPQEDYLAGKVLSPPPTQILGQAAFDAGNIIGLKYRSSKNVPTAFSIVVFTDRLIPGLTLLEVFNKPTGTLQQKLP